MKKEEYAAQSLAALKELAKSRKMRGISTMKKGDLIEALVAFDTAHAEFTGETGKTAEKRQEPGVHTAEHPSKTGEAAASTEKKPEAEKRKTRTAHREFTGGEITRNGGRFRRLDSDARRQEYSGQQDGRRERTGVSRGVRRDNTQSSNYRRDSQESSGYTGYRRESQEAGYTSYSNRFSCRNNNAAASQPGTNGESAEQAGNASYRSQGQRSNTAESEQERNTGAAQTQELRSDDRPSQDLSSLDSGQEACGILEVMNEGFGFIRSDNFMSGDSDVYVSPSQIRRFGLRTGDIISGNTRIKTMQEKYSALLYLKTINGMAPSEAMKRSKFEDMTPVFPNERLCMERGSSGIAMRIVDLFSPIGKGQRGMIVSPPKAGKTTLLKEVAHSILENDPKMQLIILLIDERPEEVTDIKEAICGDNVEVIYSTFDEQPEHHKRVSEMVIERAKRLVEQKMDVTILLDSITRLARAYNLTVPPSGRTLSGGLDPAALYMPKRFFGAARNMREGGSLTILATALVDTGSKMDDVVYEEFKGTGNMELVLDRKLSERRVFPAIDIPKSGTRREDLLLDREEQEAVYIMRRALNGMKSEDAVENILNMFVHTKTNRELVAQVRRQRFV